MGRRRKEEKGRDMERREREGGESEEGGEKKEREDDKRKREDERAPFSFEPGLDLEPPANNKTSLHLRTDKPNKPLTLHLQTIINRQTFTTPTNNKNTYL